MIIRSKKTLAGIGVVFVMAVATYFLIDDAEFFESYFSIPAVAALVAALFVLLKDYLAYERELILQDRKNNFLVGASSHMANVAFDKHVEFAEEYAAEINEAVKTLFKEGPTKGVLSHTNKMYAIQQKYSVWLTVTIEKDLEEFEGDLRTIGAIAGLLQETAKVDNRQDSFRKMNKKFAEVMGIEGWLDEELDVERAASAAIRRLRSILGTEELTNLRSAIVKKAATQIKSDSP